MLPDHQQWSPTSRRVGGFFPGVLEGDAYRFFVVRTLLSRLQARPIRARAGVRQLPQLLVHRSQPTQLPVGRPRFSPPPFNELVVYQFHFGVYFAEELKHGRDIRPHRVCKFLDAIGRIEYWAALGINAVMPLPFQNFRPKTASATTAPICL